jgi:hypothetical protein
MCYIQLFSQSCVANVARYMQINKEMLCYTKRNFRDHPPLPSSFLGTNRGLEVDVNID